MKLASGDWHRFSTKTTDLEKAKDAALKFYFAAEERLKNKLPQNTRRFKQVADYACERMRNELASGGGRIAFKDYIAAIDRYLIPYFGKWDVASIDVASLQKFDAWRTEQMGRKAAHSTINTHNSALNRVLDEAELRGWITGSIRRECPIFCVTGIWSMLIETGKDDDDDNFQGSAGRVAEGLQAA